MTRRRCHPAEIAKHFDIAAVVFSNVPYLQDRYIEIDHSYSTVDTQFVQDLSHLAPEHPNSIDTKPWNLGELRAGYEWFAATFQGQAEIEWTEEELAMFIGDSSRQAAAYKRMMPSVVEHDHPWARHTTAEVESILRTVKAPHGLPRGSEILDAGCGTGRHAAELARRGYSVTALDQMPDRPSKLVTAVDVRYVSADLLRWKPDREFPLVLALYDVLGSYPNDEANLRLFRTLARSVAPGGHLIFSVMSYKYIAKLARHKCKGDPHKHISRIAPSTHMQKTGEIFDPERLLVDTRSRVVYRREEFSDVPGEPRILPVADRRYEISELEKMCQRERLTVTSAGYVRAGQFDEPQCTEPTKEILVVARRDGFL